LYYSYLKCMLFKFVVNDKNLVFFRASLKISSFKNKKSFFVVSCCDFQNFFFTFPLFFFNKRISKNVSIFFSPFSNLNFQTFFKKFNFIFFSKPFFFYKVTIQGLGFNFKVSRNNSKFFKIFAGYSHSLFIYLPQDVFMVENCTQSFFIFGLDKQKLGHTVRQILFLKKFSPFKKKGLFFYRLVI